MRLCNAPLMPADTVKLSYFLEAIPNLEKVKIILCTYACLYKSIFSKVYSTLAR